MGKQNQKPIKKNISDMRNYLYTKGTATAARRLAAAGLLLFAFFGNAWAQSSSDPKYVIKRTVSDVDHYLAHVEIEATMLNHAGTADSTYWYWKLKDVTSFNPDSCLWQSGPNIGYNYYFVDTHYSKYHYLKAPLELNGPLSLSASHPGTQTLNITTQDYYFYDWDHGVARGVQHPVASMNDCDPNYHIPDNLQQCWQVVWVTYNGGWKMSSQYSYNPDPNYITNAANYRKVTVTDHAEEKTNESGGVNCSGITDITLASVGDHVTLSGAASDYTYTLTPAYTLYDIEAVNNTFFPNIDREYYYYYGGAINNTPPPTTNYTLHIENHVWSISGDDEGCLTIDDPTSFTPTLTYSTQNTSTSHELVTLTLTVTFEGGLTQTCTATVLVKTQCQNPEQASSPVVSYNDVTVSWLATADSYTVSWIKDGEDWPQAASASVGDVTSYTITGLEYATTYHYRVKADCMATDPTFEYDFITESQPSTLVYGAVFGGGRMANVVGKTEVVIINCEDISAVYGGNDIAGEVEGDDGSKITLGVNSGDEYDTYGTTTNSVGVNIGSVYGGGNGYYAYNGTSFEPASSDYTSQVVAANGGHVNAMTPSHQVGDPVWTNTGTDPVTLEFPSIVKTAITVSDNDYVKVDSLFGGAKNAFLTFDDYTSNGSTIIIKGGTLFAVFGGNNFGGTQGYGKHHIEVQGTKASTAVDGYGTDFGIGYLFGGGNKVYGSTTEIFITGGRCDTVFAGGNSASVYAANLTVNCGVGALADGAYGNVYSSAISDYSAETGISVSDSYAWNGTGIYNIRTLFGGNNQADMEAVPTLTLTSGGIGTAYGGGNAGDMLAQTETTLTIPNSFKNGTINTEDIPIKYSTHVVLTENSNILIDNLYGGCQMSNVKYSAWTEVQGGHVGTVYGGCNISGDVGSTREYMDATPFINVDEPNPDYQVVYGATFVIASGGTVYKDLFAGSNGKYQCNDGFRYSHGLNYENQHDNEDGPYVGMLIPTHNETYAIVKDNAHIKGNVYAGANMAPVGFTIAYVSQFQQYPSLVGLAVVRMCGGIVDGCVFGGGNMASINGSNEVQISGGSIGVAKNGALYGGNDRTGQAGQISNRVLPDSYNTASDGVTSLKYPEKVQTYIGVTGRPTINTVYGGGNGLYEYFSTFAAASGYSGPLEPVVSCNPDDQPIQTNIFVDIALEGGAGGQTPGHIDYVYGGGNGVTADGFVKVFVNVQNMNTTAGVISDDVHIGTVFGGNNIGALDVPADIILLNGHVGDVYGGCNAGSMSADLNHTLTFNNINGHTYDQIGSYVRLMKEYDGNSGDEIPAVGTNVRISGNVYGGCRMNDVMGIDRNDPSIHYNTNTLVLVEDDIHSATLFGGCDIKGKVWGVSQVVMTGGHVNKIFGGGNGNYTYTPGGDVYTVGDDPVLVATGISATDAPSCANTQVDLWGGSIGNVSPGIMGQVFGGGWGQHTTVPGNVNIHFGEDDNVAHDEPLLIGELYGGSALGSVNTDADNTVTINVNNGVIDGYDLTHPATPYENVYGKVFGGGLGSAGVEAMVYGKVYVNVGSASNVFQSNTFRGKATLINCDIFGCNNTNGSPQDEVYVTIYSTAHIDGTNTVDDMDFAIYRVYGGGNEADYAPEDGLLTSSKKTHVFVHGCENTIKYVYGGGNAADAVGVVTIISGGHYSEIYGGGNGAVTPANIGEGCISQAVLAGTVSYLYEGSNKQGSCPCPQTLTPDVTGFVDCGDLIVESFYFGDNEAEHYGDIVNTIECEDAENFHYTYLFGGSRWAIVYGDIKLTVCGGEIDRLFGGSKGYAQDLVPAHVRRFPTFAEIDADQALDPEDRKYSQALLDHMGYPAGPEPDYVGKGGNIELTITGGTIGEVIGGCDELGNVEGRIRVIVDDANSPTCPLQIGTIYGASNLTIYEPLDDDNKGVYYNPEGSHAAEAISTPKVLVVNGEVTGNIYGGANQGTITSNPLIIIGDGTTGSSATPVTVGGDIYGGGNRGNVKGSPKVVVVPLKHNVTYNANPTGGTIRVATFDGNLVSTGASVGEDLELKLTAIPDIYHYKFNQWTVTGTGASVIDASKATTSFVMGTADAEISASFVAVTPHDFSYSVSPASGGSIVVTDGLGNAVSSGADIVEGSVLNIRAIPDVLNGYKFKEWQVTNGSIANLQSTSTTFTMGSSGDATITAVFETVATHTITYDASPTGGTVEVTYDDGTGSPVTISSGTSVSEGAVLDIKATPSSGYEFHQWTATNGTVKKASAAVTKFTMGAGGNATLEAQFQSTTP